MSIKYIAKGIANREGKSFEVYLDWSDEGGGWYQWRESKAWAKLFDTEKEALEIAKQGHGPWFNKPKLKSIVIEAIDTQPQITSLESHNRELLAVIAVKDEALRNVETELCLDNWRGDLRESINDAVAIKPGDIALVEVGIVVENNLTHWQTMPVSAEFNSNELKINDKLYVLQKKEGK